MNSNVNNFGLTIKNYRCFPDEKPIHISIGKGFTALVGPNNSGKSALLKLFYELRDLFTSINRSDDGLVVAIRSGGYTTFDLPNTISDRTEIFCNANNRDIVLEISANADSLGENYEGISPEKIILIISRDRNIFKAELNVDGKHIADRRDSVKRIGNSNIKIGDITLNMEAYYRVFEMLSKTVYIGPFRNAVNIGGTEPYYDIQIGQQFISLWDDYKSGQSKRSTQAALKLTEDIRAIFGFNTLEINASKDNRTLHVIINGKPYRLEEIGSGLAQFIVILSNIAIKQPSWILIDEPELNLHPTLQIDFLTTLTSYATEGIVFSTHNIGLARACAERIYSVRVDKLGLSEVADLETMPKLSEFLGELSFSGYRDLGHNKVLLVEGATEVKTIQQLLRKYGKDHKIVLLSLGGSGLINTTSEMELNEIRRITDHVLALIDSELDSSDDSLPPERKTFLEICKKIGINCHVLKRRATENYMSDKAVKAIKGEKYRSLEPYEKLKDVSPCWGKQENWRIAREMTREEIDRTDLGEFLNSL